MSKHYCDIDAMPLIYFCQNNSNPVTNHGNVVAKIPNYFGV